MQFSIIALLSIASVAVATPTGSIFKVTSLKARSMQTAAGGCSNMQSVACCNQANDATGGKATAGNSNILDGILAGDAVNALNLNCNNLAVNILSPGSSTGVQCAGQQQICCDMKDGKPNPESCHKA